LATVTLTSLTSINIVVLLHYFHQILQLSI